MLTFLATVFIVVPKNHCEMHDCCNYVTAELRDPKISSPAMHSAGPGLKSLPGDRLP
jgi:hypothetical protein